MRMPNRHPPILEHSRYACSTSLPPQAVVKQGLLAARRHITPNRGSVNLHFRSLVARWQQAAVCAKRSDAGPNAILWHKHHSPPASPTLPEWHPLQLEPCPFPLPQQPVSWVATESTVIHHESMISNRFLHVAHNRRSFVRRWSGRVRAGDQDCYSPDGFSVTRYQADSPQTLPTDFQVYGEQIAATSPQHCRASADFSQMPITLS